MWVMEIEYDPNKNKANIKKHGVSFEMVHDFNFDYVLEVMQIVDNETRYFALGFIHTRLYALVYTFRAETIRIISLRKATKNNH